ncbi:MAG: hypothetical protein ACKPKO_41095 [Candidatus Fonsibacter sp.]
MATSTTVCKKHIQMKHMLDNIQKMKSSFEEIQFGNSHIFE